MVVLLHVSEFAPGEQVPPNRQGRLFVFEGPNNCGKTTLANALVDQLNNMKFRSEYLAFPGRRTGSLGKHIYALHHNPGTYAIETLSSTSLQLLHVAAHVDEIETSILPAISSGTNIVLDRFWWSTWVYGRLTGVSDKLAQSMIKLELQCWNGVQPTLLFALRRREPLAAYNGPAWSSLQEEYSKLVQQEKVKYPIHEFENEGSAEAATEHVVGVVESYLRTVDA